MSAALAGPSTNFRPRGRDRERLASRSAASKGWWAVTDSNRRHPACKAGALPAELTALPHLYRCAMARRKCTSGGAVETPPRYYTTRATRYAGRRSGRSGRIRLGGSRGMSGRGAETGSERLLLAHVGALLGVAVARAAPVMEGFPAEHESHGR